MGLRFRRSIRLGKYARINIGKTGMSLSAGVRGAHITAGKNGIRKTVGIPGSGLSYTKYDKYGGKEKTDQLQSNIPMQYKLPEGVAVPTDYKLHMIWFWIGLSSLIVGFINPLFLLLSVGCFIGYTISLFFNRGYKNALDMQIAIGDFKKGKFKSCIKWCNKLLKHRDYEGAKILITESEKLLGQEEK